jgi:peptidoglycan hydrolase-like protein with peptidoglycan-binding domain
MPVMDAQRKLTELGLQPGPIDGAMGPRTAAALRQFQRNERIPQSGVLDAATSARLRTARR